jgi:molybdate transport system substrate-binding protein
MFGALRRCFFCLFAWILFAPTPPLLAEPALVAAAADLKFALRELAELFRQSSGQEVKLIFGSSGVITSQIQQGAPFELFLSADEAYVETLFRAGLTIDGGRIYGIGRIGLFAPKGSPIAVDEQLVGLTSALRQGQVKKFAIANPAHAPYGRAARQAFEKKQLWSMIEPLLVLGDNVAQATQFATSGSTEGGIIPLALALAPEVGSRGSFALIPEDWHEPLRQRMVLTKNAGPGARAFHDWLQAAPARAVFERFGFKLPAAQ